MRNKQPQMRKSNFLFWKSPITSRVCVDDCAAVVIALKLVHVRLETKEKASYSQ